MLVFSQRVVFVSRQRLIHDEKTKNYRERISVAGSVVSHVSDSEKGMTALVFATASGSGCHV